MLQKGFNQTQVPVIETVSNNSNFILVKDAIYALWKPAKGTA